MQSTEYVAFFFRLTDDAKVDAEGPHPKCNLVVELNLIPNPQNADMNSAYCTRFFFLFAGDLTGETFVI